MDNRTLIRSGEARLVGWSRQMLYSGFNILPRSVIRLASSIDRSDNLDVIPSPLPSSMIHTKIQSRLEDVITPHEFTLVTAIGPDPNAMGAWYLEYQTPEFLVTLSQDRTGDVACVCVGSRIRHKPRGHMRGPWSMSHLRGYLDGMLDHFIFDSADEQISWLHDHADTILMTTFLNSNKLNQWSVNASRRLFG